MNAAKRLQRKTGKMEQRLENSLPLSEGRGVKSGSGLGKKQQINSMNSTDAFIIDISKIHVCVCLSMFVCIADVFLRRDRLCGLCFLTLRVL